MTRVLQQPLANQRRWSLCRRAKTGRERNAPHCVCDQTSSISAA